MAYVSAQARQELLDAVAEAADEIGVALSALGDAFDHLDDQSADRLEEQLFRPVQHAYGRAQRTHNEFAGRVSLPTRTFTPAGPPAPHGAAAALEVAVDAVAEADEKLATLQDSMRPVEVGDAELRAGLSEVRRLLGDVEQRARAFERTRGR